jgi:hypothetical protein
MCSCGEAEQDTSHILQAIQEPSGILNTNINTGGFFFFSFTLGLQLPLRIWWSSVGHPRIHKASPGVLLVMAISLLSIPDGSCMSVKCGRYLALPLHVKYCQLEIIRNVKIPNFIVYKLFLALEMLPN